MTERPRGPVDPDAPVLAPREEQALAQAVRPVAGRGRGATVAAALIVLAFVVELVRPWDFVGDGIAPPGTVPVGSGAPAQGTPPPDSTDDQGAQGPLASGPGAAAPTCGYPQDWRSATIQRWAGRRARVWSAVDVASSAAGPQDPAIPLNVVAGEDFTAIGWCAPISGADRPPVGVQGRLFRVAADGTADELSHRRLEPPAPSALGELWVPDGSPGSAGTAWPPGRYVIALASPDGTWSRWLGIELRAVPVGSDVVITGPSPAPSGPSPGSSGRASPVPTPSATG